jgi:uncharacterized membrane protein
VNKYETLLFLHLVSAFLLVGGAGVSTAAGIVAGKTTSTKLLAALGDLGSKADLYVTVPGAIGAIAFGTWLAHYAGFDFGDTWLTLAYLLFLLALGIGTGVLGRHARRIGRKARALSDDGVEESDELRVEAASPAMSFLGMVEIAIVILFVWDMVAKPGA